MALRNFWRIEIEKGIKSLSSMIVPTGQISDNNIEKLIEVLISKYMLSDEEIISSLCNKNTKRHQNYFQYNREARPEGERVRINYYAQMSSISIVITLVYENELTEIEKDKIKLTSTFNIK